MPLKTYLRKRNFKITSEPAAAAGKPHRQPIFVVQEHHASTLHYDFRLEADGVLKSWAVTKEPVLDPAIRRLAVEVEDHPLAYAKFKGDIPEGQYGAGHVEIWDHGTYRNLMAGKKEPMSISEGIAAGHVEVHLHGKRLNGAFALIRMKGNKGKNWLLVKMKDGAARTEKSPEKDIKKKKIEEEETVTKKKRTTTSPTRKHEQPPEDIAFTHTDKVMFPEAGITKGDVLHFYERIADRLLPHLIDRPMTLERLPEGLASRNSPHFWQKDTPDYYPDWIPRMELETTEGKTVEYVLVNDSKTLLYLVNQGTITFHPWLSRVGSLDIPDFVLFDLDPGPLTFADAMKVARKLRSLLRNEEVDAYVKTSGKTGLHVLTPWKSKGTYDDAREWAMERAEHVAAALPEIATTERRIAAREGRLYLDVMQNARGHHAVPPYMLRAVPGATVSAPLRWEELKNQLAPSEFTIRTMLRRIAHQRSDPMAPLTEFSNRR